MNQDYQCPTHGHMLTKALSSEGDFVLLPEALKAKHEKYFCPNPECRIRVVPEGGKIVRAGDYYRRGHFNAVPEHKERYDGRKRESLVELVRDAIAASLRYSRDFDYVDTNVQFESQHYNDGEKDESKKGWWKFKDFNVDVVARREGRESLDVILHLVELPLKRADDLYQTIKEVADEQKPSVKRKYIKTSEGKKVPLNTRVYQNFVVIKNWKSYETAGRNKVQLVPTVYNFIGDLSGNIFYLDPDTMNPFLLSISNPEKVESEVEHDPRRIFKTKIEEIPYFSFIGQDIGKVQKELKNWPGRNSINITHWKLAVPTRINIDKNGNPVSVTRKGGQIEMLF